MIRVTDVSGNPVYVNSNLIEKIEVVPDTLLVLVNGQRQMVRESAPEIVRRIESFRRKCKVIPVQRIHAAHPVELNIA